jgi:hypothetical protein
VRELASLCPSIQTLTVGKNFTTEHHQGYTTGLVVRFADAEGLKAYQEHPAHVAVVKVR